MKWLRSGEALRLALSFLYFLSLLASYYILRPIRDSLLAGIGTHQLKILAPTVLIVMLAITPVFGALMARIPRFKLLPAIYLFAIVNLLAFAVAFTRPELAELTARVFYVWVTVFSLFVVSVFWSFMADIWNAEQSRRLFGVIAAGGSCGGLLGPSLARHFAESLGHGDLVLVAAAFLIVSIICLLLLSRWVPTQHLTRAPEIPFGGSSWQGLVLVVRSPFLLGIAMLVALTAMAGMFAYIETGRLAREVIATPEARTAFFARVDFWTNTTTLILQFAVVGPLTARFGIRAPLLGLAILGTLSFVPLILAPSLTAYGITNVLRRSAEYGLGKTGRDMLYTVATPQEKYLAKNVIDTIVYRATDTLGSWLHPALVAMGVTLPGRRLRGYDDGSHPVPLAGGGARL